MHCPRAMVNFDELWVQLQNQQGKTADHAQYDWFQSVLHGICSPSGAQTGKQISLLISSRSSTPLSGELNEFYYQIREQPWALGPGLPVMDMKNMPAKPLVFQSGNDECRAGVDDIYLWIFKRYMEQKELTRPLSRLIYTNLKTARTAVFLCSLPRNGLRVFENFRTNFCRNDGKKQNELRAVEETRRLAHRVQSIVRNPDQKG